MTGDDRMPTEMKRLMICVTPEIEAGVEELKKNVFYNKPYSEVYRYLLAKGIKSATEDTEKSE
jgi:hypothetical protein